MNPRVNTPKNAIIDQNPKSPTSRKQIDQGTRKVTSRSKIMKRIATI